MYFLPVKSLRSALRKFTLLRYCFFVFCLSSCSVVGNLFAGNSLREQRTVVAVVDGTTVVLNGGEHVRLIGISPREMQSARRQITSLSKEARQFLVSVAEGKSVYLRFDRFKRDKQGRTLGYVFLSDDDKLLNAEMIRFGFASSLTRYPYYRQDEFERIEQQARARRVGMWQR